MTGPQLDGVLHAVGRLNGQPAGNDTGGERRFKSTRKPKKKS